MIIIRVHQNSKSLFEYFLCKNNIPTSKAHVISLGAYDNYGTYINKDVSVFGFMAADKQFSDLVEMEAQQDPTAKLTYKKFSSNEFFF